ncbi:Sister chromatid cohesion protein DCC1 [Cordyceps fumosorosea ARSEF 2679]|uniref:Sister chromatid cohesion protein DCC1 n=1 Tax=Cordyceps fumosorosea (strain ARSEF 2679) TaxID=1081104 RepID=A0A167TNM1_CORFA|nr:Sister chromatid cohesion protein DCC1 [Cordyceps fumosorosea ARSEF 2679]OAA60785.1 Sister chromatid cohesion protein DCC1 [Cordyceps fumosorosea ARSEF 2679]
MSSQNQGIPFYNASDSSGFRLIEIPPELETLLQGPNPPVLYLEPGPDDMATLRSPEHTYNLKQKNTSNSLFLVKPYTADAASPQQGVAAVATIKETVELERVKKMTDGEPAPPAKTVGKWHERFAHGR